MPIKFGTDEEIRSPVDTYTIETLLSQGAFAHAARARSARRGQPVFLKRYFSPTRALDWYEGFVAHQQELKHRITANDGLKQYCYGFIDFFEGTSGRANRTFHQVFEFVDNGLSLTEFLATATGEGADARWEQRVTFARVMLMGITALHSARIVHTDLKPDNLLLLPNPHAPGSFHLKLIDLDWSIFSDRQAPWHGKGVGYVGTPGYLSPEHLRGEVPSEGSDVFTCALMLGELLGGGHPFAHHRGEDASLAHAVLGGHSRPFTLMRPIDKVKNSGFLEALVNQALHPEPDRRPTAAALRDALFGRGEAGLSPAPAPASASPPAAPAVAHPPTARATPPAPVNLYLEGVAVLRLSIDTVVGRQLVKPLGPDARFFADRQFRIFKSPTRGWMIEPLPDTPNETLVNGERLTAPRVLTDGLRIAVGHAAKGIEKLPLVVKLG